MNTSSLHLSKDFSFMLSFSGKRLYLFSFLFLQTIAGFSQGLISQTELKSIPRNEYEAGAQNWAIVQDEKKRLYIANNEGLLVYDGTDWQLYPVPNKTILRSIGFGPDGKLYAGAQDELGYFAPDEVGRLQFTSLKHLLPLKDQRFSDIWQLEVNGEEVFFRTDANIFKLSGGKLEVYPARSIWLSLHSHQGQILAHDRQLGLLIYQNNQWESFIPKASLPSNFLLSDLIDYQNGYSMLSTAENGLYLLKENELIPFELNSLKIEANQYFTALSVLDTETFLAGTYQNGIYKISSEGEVLENISTENGLPNNTVRCLFTDGNHIWTGLDNGLAFFTYDEAIKRINPPVFNNGTGYDAKALKGDLYFALSTGLFCFPEQSTGGVRADSQESQTILSGLTWSLSLIQDQLLAGRDDGLFRVQDKVASPIKQSTGFWSCRPIEAESSSRIIAGNYLGLDFFEMREEKFIQSDSLEKFKESSRYIETDGNSVWVSHPYRGVYRINLPDQSIQSFSEKEGLPDNLDNHVFKIRGKIVFATPRGIYEYDSKKDRILKSKEYAEIFGEKPIRYMKEDEEGNIWFVQEKMLGVVDFSSVKALVHYIPELKNKIVSGFENIFPYDARNILIGSEPGFYHLNYEKYLEKIEPFSVYLSQVKTSGIKDSILFGGYVFEGKGEKAPIKVPYQLNSLFFSYTASVYDPGSGLEYSYYLEGFDMDWSHWSTSTEKEYTNLPAGTYTFKVKARKSPSHESSVHQFTFTVQTPWYQSIWVYGLYVILFGAFILGILSYQAKMYRKKQADKQKVAEQKFEEEQKQLAYQHQLELAESEKEIIQLRNEKLDNEIKHKNAELASATMNLAQKKELILKIKKELLQLQKNTKTKSNTVEMKQLLKELSEEQKLDEEWDKFFQHFNSVHGDFLRILKEKYPDLSPHYLRLCAYLRMNLSSKEIAPLMGISLRGVEINRYRLRKKMDLPTEVNLVEYLLSI